jgi:hypothetical protein
MERTKSFTHMSYTNSDSMHLKIGK